MGWGLGTDIVASLLPSYDSSVTRQPLACWRLMPAACSSVQRDSCLQDYYSIEHNSAWFEQVRAKLEADEAVKNVHMLLVRIPRGCLERMQP